MDKLVCKCGNIIISQAGDYSNKSMIINNQDVEEFIDLISGSIGILLSYKLEGIDRLDWIIDHLGEDYPADTSMVQVMRDYITRMWIEHSDQTYYCKNCGALWFRENENSTNFRCYHPE